MSALHAVIRPAVAWCARLLSVRENVSLGRRIHIGLGSSLWAPTELIVEDDVYIGKGVTIECDGRIGSGTIIANRVGLVGRCDHDFRQVGVLVRHSSWVGDCAEHPGRQLRIDVGEDVWVGFAAVVLSGVRIGRGAVIGAGAVVVKDVPPYAIVVGNPSREVGRRFSDGVIQSHEEALQSCEGTLARESTRLGGLDE